MLPAMQFSKPLIEGRLERRYKRFLADVTAPGIGLVTAHCPNPGAMLGVAPPGARVWLSASDNPKRKLKHTLELVEVDATLVGVNTNAPNALAEEAVAAGVIPELSDYQSLRREVRYGTNSRIDLLLRHDDRPDCFVEVKNVHLRRRPGLAEFPDCVTTRGAKHLKELAEQVDAGARAVQLFIIQRADCERFALAKDLDPGYAAAFAEATARGVEPLAYACAVTPAGIEVTQRVPIEISAAISAP